MACRVQFEFPAHKDGACDEEKVSKSSEGGHKVALGRFFSALKKREGRPKPNKKFGSW
jgi:hypothetical protein